MEKEPQILKIRTKSHYLHSKQDNERVMLDATLVGRQPLSD
jgi:hypothetical protein